MCGRKCSRAVWPEEGGRQVSGQADRYLGRQTGIWAGRQVSGGQASVAVEMQGSVSFLCFSDTLSFWEVKQRIGVWSHSDSHNPPDPRSAVALCRVAPGEQLWCNLKCNTNRAQRVYDHSHLSLQVVSPD
ncbi:unnamed protein product [Boreogadus saida]